MYQALYRVWRPKTFSDMVGQEAIVRTLRNQVITGHIAHAYLFCGSRGTGKTSAAKIMARAINCENPQNGDPCGQCSSCQTISQDASFDVYEMDAASNSRVEEIRELLDKVDYPPQFGKYKVYIIDEVHMLSNAAFNALLKTLEEPPAYMVFILATTEPQKIPATILSRCQRFDFGRFTDDELIGRMKEAAASLNAQVTDDAFALIAQSAEGGMRDALSLLDMCIGAGGEVTEDSVRLVLGAADKGFLFKFADAIADANSATVLRMIDQLMKTGLDVQVFLKDLNRHFRTLLSVRLSVSDKVKKDDAYAVQAQKFSNDRLLRIIDLLMHAEADTRWSQSARAVLEVCALKACEKPEEKNVDALLERISELEAKLSRIASGGIVCQTAKSAPSESPAPQEKPFVPEIDAVPEGEKKPKDIWNDALDILKAEQSSIFSIFQNGVFGGYKDHTYRIVFEGNNEFFIPILNAEGKKKIIVDALTRAGAVGADFEAIPKPVKISVAQQIRTETAMSALEETFDRDQIIRESGPAPV